MRKNTVYPWFICIIGLMMFFCACGLMIGTFSVHYSYIKDELGLSGTQISSLTTVRSLATLITINFVSMYYEKNGLRKGIPLAFSLGITAFLIMSLSDNYVVFLVCSILMGMFFPLGSMIPISIMIRNWFANKNSTALAIASCGSSLAVAIVPNIIVRLNNTFGFHHTLQLEAVFMIICALIIALFMRDYPKELGLKPYGLDVKKTSDINTETNDLKVISRKGLVLLCISTFLTGAAVTPGLSHFNIHFVSSGFSAEVAATAFSLYGLLMIPSKFLFGIIADKIGIRKTNFIYIPLFGIASFLISIVAGKPVAILYIISILVGIGSPITTVGTTLWCEGLTSKSDTSRVVQKGQSFCSFGEFAFSTLPGLFYDYTGSYSGFYILSFMCIIVVFLIMGYLFRYCSKV